MGNKVDYMSQLKKMVGDLFNAAESKEDIEKLSNINSALDGLQKQTEELEHNHSELLGEYKNLISHTSFPNSKVEPSDPTGAPVVRSLEDQLKDFLARKGK